MGDLTPPPRAKPPTIYVFRDFVGVYASDAKTFNLSTGRAYVRVKDAAPYEVMCDVDSRKSPESLARQFKIKF